MTKTEVRHLRVGSKFTYKSPWGYTAKRTVKFIAWMEYKPYVIFYGSRYNQRVEYEHLLSDRYTLIER